MSALDDLRDAERAIHGAEDTDRVYALRKAARAVLAGRRDTMQLPRDLAASLVEGDECTFDHHGGCQAHGYLDLRQGDVCPQAELKSLLAASEAARNG